MAPLPKTLKIIEVNVNSLVSLSRRHSLSSFLDAHKPHIALIVETHLKPFHKFAHRDYSIFRNDRPDRRGGGTAVLVKNSIKADQSYFSNSLVEYTAVRIPLSGSQNLLVASLYNPQAPSSSLIDSLNTLLLLADSSSVIIGGDFNAKHTFWGNDISSTNPSGTALHNWLLNNTLASSLNLHPTSLPTRHANNSHSFIDFFIASNSVSVTYHPHSPGFLRTLPYDSDHDAVEIICSLTSPPLLQEPITVPDFARADWRTFSSLVSSQLEQVDIPENVCLTRDEIDSVIGQITSILNSSARSTIPLVRLNKNVSLPLPNSILNVIKFKNSLRRRLFRKRYSSPCQLLKSQILCLNTLIRELISIHHRNHWERLVTSIPHKPNPDLFKTVRNLCGATKHKPISPLVVDPALPPLSSDSDIANAFGNFFQQIHLRNIHLGPSAHSLSINTLIHREFANNSAPIIPLSNSHSLSDIEGDTFLQTGLPVCTPLLVHSLIRSRKPKKGPDLDGVSTFLLKKSPFLLSVKLAVLFNHLVNIGHFPSSWKKASVIPVPKGDARTNVLNGYRPISILSSLGKVFELYLAEAIKMHCLDHSVIPPFQFGFQPNVSTGHALACLSQAVANNLNRGIPTIAISLDIEKAFDSAWFEGIIYKMLHTFNFNINVCRLVYNFLINRTAQVKVKETLSPAFTPAAGVPQGSVLGPLLYNIFTADIPLPSHHYPSIFTLCYADDTIIFSSDRNIERTSRHMQAYLSKLYLYFDKWKLKVNISKSSSISFSPRSASIPHKITKQLRNISFKLNNSPIPHRKFLKYLGVTFAANFKFTSHVEGMRTKCLKILGFLNRLLKPSTHLYPKVKLVIYKQLVRSLLSYAHHIWFNISSSQMEKFSLIERKCLRASLNIRRNPINFHYISNRNLYKTCAIDKLDKYLFDQSLKLSTKLSTSSNPLLNSLYSDTIEWPLDVTRFLGPLHLPLLHSSNRIYDEESKEAIYYAKASRLPASVLDASL